MKTRWTKLCRSIGVGDGAAMVFDVIEAMYAKPPRAYHSLEHVKACLTLLDQHANLADDPESVELAIWFHDAVYDAKQSGNEKRSAEVARNMLDGLGMRADTVKLVGELIESTEHAFGMIDAQGDKALILDIDLAILGSERQAYARFASAIRTEYAFVDDAAFAQGRAEFLRTMLDRSRVFRTDKFFEQFESIARQNLAWEIDQLPAS